MVHFGVIFGVILGRFWDHFGSIFGVPTWGAFRGLGGPFFVGFITIFALSKKPVLAWEREARAKGSMLERGGECQRAGGGAAAA